MTKVAATFIVYMCIFLNAFQEKEAHCGQQNTM